MKQCRNLQEIRTEIDRLDALLVPLLCERINYVGQAAAFKPTRADVVVPERIEFIVERVRRMAAEQGQDAAVQDVLEEIYRRLIDASIAHEDRRWVASRQG